MTSMAAAIGLSDSTEYPPSANLVSEARKYDRGKPLPVSRSKKPTNVNNWKKGLWTIQQKKIRLANNQGQSLHKRMKAMKY